MGRGDVKSKCLVKKRSWQARIPPPATLPFKNEGYFKLSKTKIFSIKHNKLYWPHRKCERGSSSRELVSSKKAGLPPVRTPREHCDPGEGARASLGRDVEVRVWEMCN